MLFIRQAIPHTKYFKKILIISSCAHCRKVAIWLTDHLNVHFRVDEKIIWLSKKKWEKKSFDTFQFSCLAWYMVFGWLSNEMVKIGVKCWMDCLRNYWELAEK